MRILVNGWFWNQDTTGSGQYLRALAAFLPRTGEAHEWFLALPQAHTTPLSLPEGWQPVAVQPPGRLDRNAAKLWFEQVQFPRLCARLRADVGFVPYWGSPWWRPCPMVVTVHDLIPLLLPLYRGGALQRAYTRLASATARRTAAVLTDSEASRHDIVRHLRIGESRVHAVHLAAGPCADSGRQHEALAVDEPYLLYLGGFDARKNVLRVVRAFAGLVARCEREGREAPQLVIAGRLPALDSAFAPDPRPLVKALGLGDRVRFLGWVEEADKAALYRGALAVLFVSEYEGFGLPVLEAMACDEAGLTGALADQSR